MCARISHLDALFYSSICIYASRSFIYENQKSCLPNYSVPYFSYAIFNNKKGTRTLYSFAALRYKFYFFLCHLEAFKSFVRASSLLHPLRSLL